MNDCNTNNNDNNNMIILSICIHSSPPYYDVFFISSAFFQLSLSVAELFKRLKKPPMLFKCCLLHKVQSQGLA